MIDLKTASCLTMSAIFSAPALAHEMHVPHEHGHGFGLVLGAALVVLCALAASVLTERSKGNNK